MSFLENLSWRYATKKYNGETVSPEHLEKILEAIRLAPTASGLQPFHVVVVRDKELKDKLFDSSGQVDKKGCSHLLVFCTRTDFPKRVDDFIAEVARVRGKTLEELSAYHTSLRRDVQSFTSVDELKKWARRQAYLALGFGLAAAAELKIDASPMEGFTPEEYKKILELPEYLDPTVLMALGYRNPLDENQPEKRRKVRFPREELFSFR